MRRVFGVACILLLAIARPAGAETAASDPKAVEIADQVMKALGGKPKWDSLHYLRWSFELAVGDTVRPGRRHAWDKFTGWQRVDGTNRAGQPFTYIENLNDSTGMGWVNGNAIEGDSLKKLMRSAHGAWINDSYWFLMPYKLRDPGVTLKYDGEVKDSTTAAVYDRLALSFEKWEHLLQGMPPPPVPWTWEGWEEHDGLWFPTAHKNGNRTLYTRAVETAAEAKPKEFTAP